MSDAKDWNPVPLSEKQKYWKSLQLRAGQEVEEGRHSPRFSLITRSLVAELRSALQDAAETVEKLAEKQVELSTTPP